MERVQGQPISHSCPKIKYLEAGKLGGGAPNRNSQTDVNKSLSDGCPTTNADLPTVSLNVTNIKGSTAQRIIWKVDQTPHRKCQIRFKLQRNSIWETVVKLLQQTDLVTENLQPKTYYQYRIIIVRGGAGTGKLIKRSPTIKCRTLSAIKKLEVTSITAKANVIFATWKFLPRGNLLKLVAVGGGHKHTYTVFKQGSFELTNLLWCTKYQVLFELLNGNELVDIQDEKEISTEVPALHPPTGFSVEPLPYVLGYKIRWLPLIVSLPVSCKAGYRLRRTTVYLKNSTAFDELIDTNLTEFILKDVQPGTQYDFQVETVVGLVHSENSDTITDVTVSIPTQPMVPHVEWVDGGLMINWSQKRNTSQRLTYVHLLFVHDDNIYKQTALEELLWHVFPVNGNSNTEKNNYYNVKKFRETRVFFAVENAAGLSPFIRVAIQTDSSTSNLVDSHSVTAVVTLRSAFQKLQNIVPNKLPCDQVINRFAVVRFHVSNVAGSSAQIIELHGNPISAPPINTEEEPQESGCKLKFILIQQTANNKWYHHLPSQIFSTGNLAPDTVYKYQLQIEVVDSGLLILMERSAVVEIRTFAVSTNLELTGVLTDYNHIGLKWKRIALGNSMRIFLAAENIDKMTETLELESYNITGLSACTEYHLMVCLLCGSEMIKCTEKITLSTRYPAALAPMNLTVETIMEPIRHRIIWLPTVFKLNMTGLCNLTYRISRGKIGEPNRTEFVTAQNEIVINDIEQNITYGYTIQAVVNSHVFDAFTEEIFLLYMKEEYTLRFDKSLMSIQWPNNDKIMQWTNTSSPLHMRSIRLWTQMKHNDAYCAHVVHVTSNNTRMLKFTCYGGYRHVKSMTKNYTGSPTLISVLVTYL
ncbi:hypothetical protein EG68_08091 [Paragonimus skrjabini miyazakii]|uniref:Fibronectin type-III domain-containing protein n=1 Tax=Paragonimus skrjabini miyazakii TaxID=59628 RepID=A0A8S9YKR6_9TREM|nr:hypothetical protein EG68_08091 [Paragonimus skrjabini miyazakii]